MDKRIKAIIDFIPNSIQNISGLSKTLLKFTEYTEAEKIVSKITKGKGIPFVDMFEIIPEMNEEIKDFTFLSDTSRVIDIAFLMALARSFKSCDYLEIGSFRGESLMNVLPLTNSSVSISLSKDDMKAMSFSKDSIEVESMLVRDHPKLTRIAHNSLTYDFSKLNKKFDLIFIDGDHSTESVRQDTMNAFKLLKNDNSIIVWHDFGTHYADRRKDVIAGALLGTPKHLRHKIIRITNTLCGVYLNKTVKHLPEKANLRSPTSLFNVSLKANKLN